MKEEEIIAGNYYKIKCNLLNKSIMYYFKAAVNKSANSPHNVIMSKNRAPYIGGSLAQGNSSFKGNDYFLLNESEVLWFERCIKEKRYINYDEKEYQITQELLIF